MESIGQEANDRTEWFLANRLLQRHTQYNTARNKIGKIFEAAKTLRFWLRGKVFSQWDRHSCLSATAIAGNGKALLAWLGGITA
ncbi:MAG: hypothetical protein A3H27_14300 [Acidobacteria bacterium RIFCSPLOWO2_02_FULL_59_13]|nr:MAG: hypothetical protein A3H27_14300 [Acidobacteria bacterium RIFCSPLOWO2_02_FULL_59_13]